MSDEPYDWSGHPPILRSLAETFNHPAQRAPHDYLLRLADQIELRLSTPVPENARQQETHTR